MWPGLTAQSQVFGNDAVEAGDVAAALRDVGLALDGRCNSREGGGLQRTAALARGVTCD